jgi:hypothetical protein
MPHLAWVETRYSNAQERLGDHWYLRESVVAFGAEMERVLGRTLVIIAYDNREKAEAQVRNLKFLTRFYNQKLKGIRTLVVEQAIEETIDEKSLPLNCRYLLLSDGASFDLKKCFVAGLNCVEADCEYVILSDSNTFLDALHIRANLRMCERFDCATGYKSVVQLTESETEQVRLNNFSKGIDTTGRICPSEKRSFEAFGIFRRTVLNPRAGGLSEILGAADPDDIARDYRPRVFESPNDALLLNREP